MSAKDKDLEPVLRKLVSLCTLDLVNLMQLVDETHPMDLEDKADDLEYEMEAITEDNYLQPLYGTHGSKLAYETWVDNSVKTKSISQIWYNPDMLRKLVFARLGVSMGEDQDK